VTGGVGTAFVGVVLLVPVVPPFVVSVGVDVVVPVVAGGVVPLVVVVDPPVGAVVEPSVGVGVALAPVGTVVPPAGSVTAEDPLTLVGDVAVVGVPEVVADGSVDVDDVWPLVSGGAACVVAVAAPLESSAAAGPAIARAQVTQHSNANSAAQRDPPALVPTFSPTDTLRRPAPCSLKEYLSGKAGGHNLAFVPDRFAEAYDRGGKTFSR
jgi:hypothetical protein